MLRVADLVQTDLPVEFLAVLPKECPLCGADTEITETLTILKCTNIDCVGKAVQRMVAMLLDLGVKNMGEKNCLKFIEKFGVTNPYVFFAYDDTDGTLFEGCSEKVSYEFMDAIEAVNTMALWEYVKIGNIPQIRDSARYLLSGYSDLDDFYEDLEYGGYEFVAERLNLSSEEIGIKAVSIYDSLMQYREQLFEYLDYVNIIDTARSINICISRSVGAPFTSKKGFVTYLNKEFGDSVYINKLENVTHDCDYLVWSGLGAETSKVTKALDLVDRGISNIQIVTGEELCNILKNS